MSAPDVGSDRRYWYYDRCWFRDSDDGWFDRLLDGKWVRATGELFPSEEELDHMRPIDLDRADPDASGFVLARVRGAYEDGERLGLGELGPLDPGGEIFTEN